MDERILVLDGGTGTELARLGQAAIEGDPLWSSRLLQSNPDIVKQVHKNFLEAGADVVVTVSYQASVGGFVEHLGVTEAEAMRLIGSSVHIARQACQETKLSGKVRRVAGSVGPYGACLHDWSEFTGTYAEKMTVEELMTWHRPRVKALLEAGADILAIETIPIQKEAEAVVELLKEFPNSKAWVTFTCKDGAHTCHGEMFSSAVQSVVTSDNVVAVGVNCTDPDNITPLLKTLSNVGKPIVVKSNSGESWDKTKSWSGRREDFDLVPRVGEWVEGGARWIGGCCRIFPDDIRRIQEYLSTLKISR